MKLGEIIEGTVVLIALYLIVVNGPNFAQVVTAISSAYAGDVKALQGR